MGLSSARDPAENYAIYAASDTTNFDAPSRRIHVITGGVVQLVKKDGTVVPTPELADGTVLDVVAIRINETDTTASDFFVLH